MTFQEAAQTLVDEANIFEWIQDRKDLSGSAWCLERRIRTPPPTTVRRFCIVAHECHHILIGKRTHKRIPKYEIEYQCCLAEKAACQRFGFVMDNTDIDNNKKYVAWKLHQGLIRGLHPGKLKLTILEWCSDHLSERTKRILRNYTEEWPCTPPEWAELTRATA